MAPRTIDTADIAIADIVIGDRLRSVDAAWAEAIATSMHGTGQHQPIRVVKQKKGYRLVDGLHRLEAKRQLGEAAIRAEIIEASPLEAKLLEIDANLIRRELNPLDRATFLAERKAVYEELHPETKHGSQGGRGGKCNENDTMSFSKETAEKIGLSPRSIERAVRIHFQIDASIRKRLAGTAISEKQNELLALARQGPQRQTRIVDMLLSGEAGNVRAALRILDGHADSAPTQAGADTDEKQLKRLMDAWARSSAKARGRFLETLADQGYVTARPEEAA
jgi:ParB family chromosome partitioning protein